jgi:hypothetical protein
MSHLGGTSNDLNEADPSIMARFILLVVPRVRVTRIRIVSTVDESPTER